jgi:hypothetical protein
MTRRHLEGFGNVLKTDERAGATGAIILPLAILSMLIFSPYGPGGNGSGPKSSPDFYDDAPREGLGVCSPMR